MKYKVGDKVRVHSLKWFEQNCENNGNGDFVKNEEYSSFVKPMSKYCGSIVTICNVYNRSYSIEEFSYAWHDWMFEDIEMEKVLVPFNIEKAKAGAEVVCRDNSPARIICYDRMDDRFPLVALIKRDNSEIVVNFSADGFYLYSKDERDYDLLIKEYRPKQCTEFTMQEIADKLGIDVEKLKIKK